MNAVPERLHRALRENALAGFRVKSRVLVRTDASRQFGATPSALPAKGKS
jgi:hypothetical protein